MGAVPLTVNEADVILPLVIVQLWVPIRPVGLDAKVHAVSPVAPNANPLPETVTTLLSGPEPGLKAIVGPVTIKFAEPISPLIPLTETLYVPGVALLATVKLVADN
jgi:hypothetical protein